MGEQPGVKATHVIQGSTARAGRDDLQRGASAVGEVGAGGDVQLGDAERAVARLVPEVRREGDVEICHVRPEPEVDKDVGPRVVQVQLERAARQRPLGHITGSGRRTGACPL